VSTPTPHRLLNRRATLLAAIATGAAALAGVATLELSAADQNPARIGGKPNMNGVWEAIGSAYWNLEDHSASGLSNFWQLGAIAAIPAGQSIVEGGTIPYLPAALAQRDENRAGWPKTDPEAKCYMPGIPRATYMPYPFQIVQGDGDILFVYEFASANRVVHMGKHEESPVDSWMGWSNGHWEGDTLVIDVTNFSPKTDYRGSRQNLHLVERWTRTGPGTLDYVVTIEDPAVWTRPWTVKQELSRQSDAQNRIYYEPRCVEGNYGLPGLLRGRRTEERAFAEGRGPDPATRDNMTAGSVLDSDPLR
jgi:hypothetical protein